MNAQNVGELLARRADISPTLEAYVDPEADRRFDFQSLNSYAARCSAMLAELGLQHGDRVALLMKSGVEFVGVFYGAAKLGLVVVPLNTRLAAPELAYILANSGARALVFSSDFAGLATGIRAQDEHPVLVESWVQAGESESAGDFLSLDSLLADATDSEPDISAGGDDNLFIMYTSGTTGLPKGVVHTHDTVLWAALTWLNTLDIRFQDRLWLPLPMFHVAALIPIILAVQRGITLVVSADFNPATAWDVIEKERITVAGAVPAMLNFMRQVPQFKTADLSALRSFMTGAAPTPVELLDIYHEQGIAVTQGYSLTETAGGGCSLADEYGRSKAGSTGKAMLYTEVRVVDGSGKEVAPGESGEVLFRGPHLMKEYWNNPEATAETIVDGWLRTGDIAMVDEDGFLFIKDRIKDMIISGGENVYPAEIENALLSHPDVVEAAVIGQPSEKWGESPFAIVVPGDEALTAEDLLEHCQGKLSRFKQPTGVAFIESIPRNPAGKILKRELREQFPGPAPD